MNRRQCCLRLAILLPALALLGGCGGPADEALPPPPVTVSYPLEREVADHKDFNGRTAAVKSVEVRARVPGFLKKINFKEGAEVKKDAVLFEIDPRTYEADLTKYVEMSKSWEASLKNAQADIEREERLARAQKASSQRDYDKALASRDEAIAQLRTAKAAIARAQLDVDDTKMKAEIAGKVSKAEITEGNFVQAGQTGGTLLTTLVSMEPMYAYFDVDENTALQVRKMRGPDGKPRAADVGKLPVFLGLSDEQGFPHEGKIDFIDNQVKPGTGTIEVRGVFPNKDRSLIPGLFVRIRVPLGDPHKGLLVTERALVSELGEKFLYLVNDKDEVISRPVVVGSLNDGLREITAGLKKGDRVVVNGLQRVRPGVKVNPKLEDMPEPPVAGGNQGGAGKGSEIGKQEGAGKKDRR